MLKNVNGVVLSLVWVFLTPLFAFAATPTNFRELAELFLRIMSNIAGTMFGLLSLGVVFAVIVYMANLDNEKMRSQIKGYMMWAIVMLFVVFSIWAILTILKATIFGGTVGIIQLTPPS